MVQNIDFHFCVISIHAPRGGSDSISDFSMILLVHFNPRSPRGERLELAEQHRHDVAISIHAPRGGSDNEVLENKMTDLVFQSTLPAGGATRNFAYGLPAQCDFNPRSPRGERPITSVDMWNIFEFQSTLPAGGATMRLFVADDTGHRISIHAPRGGSDLFMVNPFFPQVRFQSTLPAGGATS